MLRESIRNKINRKNNNIFFIYFWEAGRLEEYQKGVLGVF